MLLLYVTDCNSILLTDMLDLLLVTMLRDNTHLQPAAHSLEFPHSLNLLIVLILVNPRRACAARVTVLCLFVGVSLTVSVTTLQASVVKGTLKF